MPIAILVAEDEYFLASDLTRELRRAGATVVGPVASVEAAMNLIESASQIGGAILVVNLGGDMAYSVADALMARRVPFLFTTGYDQASLPARYAAVHRLEKPVAAGLILRELERVLT